MEDGDEHLLRHKGRVVDNFAKPRSASRRNKREQITLEARCAPVAGAAVVLKA